MVVVMKVIIMKGESEAKQKLFCSFPRFSLEQENKAEQKEKLVVNKYNGKGCNWTTKGY
uniref:Uncharacterized protein n=1 Tax=Tetranychus urticae TaxID=32264 RepID=T1JQQ2_TETUR